MTDQSGEFLLKGPDGGNPLGFLAALGTLRVSTLVWRGREVRMSWQRYGTGWHPRLFVEPGIETEELLEGLYAYCRAGPAAVGRTNGQEKSPKDVDPSDAFPYFAFDKNTSKIEPDRFRSLALEARKLARPEARDFADFLAAFGCEGCVKDRYVVDTAFRTMSGSGRQRFLGTMLNLVRKVELAHLRAALLHPWRYQDPLQTLSMRWDPQDEKRYALQWQNPSGDPTRKKSGSVLGANRLSVEALPLFPTVPRARTAGPPRLATTGFEIGESQPEWTWPIWKEPINLDTCGSLLAHPRLRDVRQEERKAATREELRRMGVVEIFSSRRITVGYFRNLTPARAV